MATGQKIGSAYVDVEARLDRLETGLRQARLSIRSFGTSAERGFDAARRASDRAGQSFSRTDDTISSMRRNVRGLVAGLGTAFVGREVGRLADSYTRLDNALTAAGVSGEARVAVENRLYQAAARNGAEVEALTNLYRRAAMSGDALGATQEQLLQLTDGVAAALRLEGQSATAVRGPLLQLGQALASPIVRAEEINSVLEATPEIARAAARGLGITVAELRQAVVDGDVTNVQLFQGLLSGLEETERRASEVSLTLANAGQVFTDALARQIGQMDDSLSATERLSEGILYVANNLDTLGNAAVAVGGILAARFGAQLLQSLGREAQAVRASIAAHEARILSLRTERAEQLRNAQASQAAAAARMAEIQTTQGQVAATLRAARAQQAQSLAYLELQQGMARAGLGTGQLTNAKNQYAAATRNVIRLQQLERGLHAELTAATAAHTAATQTAAVRGAQNARVLQRTGIAARAAAGAMGVLRGAMAFLGGPIGVAITAVLGGLALWNHRAGAAERRADRLANAYRILGQEVDQYGNATERATRAQAALDRVESRRNRREIERALRDERRELERNEAFLRSYTAALEAADAAGVDRQSDDYAFLVANVDDLRDKVERGRQAVSDLEGGLEGYTDAADSAGSASRRAAGGVSTLRSESEALDDALEIVADSLGENSEAWRIQDERERAEAIATVTAALEEQQAQLLSLTAARAAAATLGSGFIDEATGAVRGGFGRRSDTSEMDAEIEATQRLIDVFQGWIDAINSGRATLDRDTEAQRERERLRREEADALGERIELEAEYRRQLTETETQLARGDTEGYSELLENLTGAMDDAQLAFNTLRQQHQAGLVDEQAYREEADRLAAVIALLNSLTAEAIALGDEYEGAKDVAEEADARDRLKTLLEQQLDHELELARLRGDDRTVERLEEEARVRARIAELTELVGRDEAERMANAESVARMSAEDQGEFREGFRRAFSDGVLAALQGDEETLARWFRDAATDGLRSALDNLADLLFDLFSQAMNQGGGKGGGGGFWSSIIGLFTGGGGFGGGKASGGNVSAGMLYKANEITGEWFAPHTDGRILTLSDMEGMAARGGRMGNAERPAPVVELRVRKGEMFDAEVTKISGNVAVQTTGAGLQMNNAEQARRAKNANYRLR